jgi:hypothetical protein
MRATRWWLGAIAALAVLAGAGALGWRAHRRAVRLPAAPAAIAGWTRGEQRHYDLTMTAEVRSDDHVVLDLALGGQWTVTALRADAEPLFQAELGAVDLKMPGLGPRDAGQLVELAKALSHPLVFTTDARGALQGASATEGEPPLVQQILTAIVANAQLVAAPGGALRWTADEADTTGRYRADYQRAGDLIHKRKLFYLEGLGGAAGPRDARTEVVSSAIEVELDGSAELRQLDFEERTRVAGAGPLPRLSSHTTQHLRLRGTGLAGDGAALLARAARAAPQPPYQRAPSTGRKLQLDEVKAAGLDVPTILRAFGRLPAEDRQHSGERARLFTALASVLRLDDRAVIQVAARVRAGDAASGTLVDALGAAGTPAAQRALVVLFRQAPADAALRRDMLISLSLVPAPTRESVDFLGTLLDDPAQGRQARYGLGSFAHQAADPEITSRCLALLYRELERPEPERVASALIALGNAGAGEALPVIEPYLDAPAPGLRAAAVRALRLVPGDHVDERLAAVLSGDREPQVRQSALVAARDRPLSAALLRGVDWAARRDPEVHIRYDAVSALAGWVNEVPTIRETMALVARTDGNERIRATASAALGQRGQARP